MLVTTVSLGIGAHAALNKRALDAARAIASEQGGATSKGSKIALVIGNGHYPDAHAPLAQPINDARALTATLRAAALTSTSSRTPARTTCAAPSRGCSPRSSRTAW